MKEWQMATPPWPGLLVNMHAPFTTECSSVIPQEHMITSDACSTLC